MDPCNTRLLRQHLACAAAELPLLPAEDAALFGGQQPVEAAAADLLSAGLLSRHPRAVGATPASHAPGALSFDNPAALASSLHYSGPGNSPASRISLRTIDPERFIIHDSANSRVLEEIEANKVWRHTGTKGRMWFVASRSPLEWGGWGAGAKAAGGSASQQPSLP